MNELLAKRVLEELIKAGVREVCYCPGGRNPSFCFILRQNEQFKTYYWHEERSAAFFALGRSRATSRPVAVIVTSGTAVGELLPAAMEAYYSGVPLILVTGDRPRKLRGTGAPQTAEQAAIFGQYALSFDIAEEESFDLDQWDQKKACHINVCFEEPRSTDEPFLLPMPQMPYPKAMPFSRKPFEDFLQTISRPLVIVSTLREAAKDAVADFLVALNAPVYLEGISNLREDSRLQHLRFHNPNFQSFDSVVRIGGIPTHRIWRDFEEKRLLIFSISEMPFKGLSYSDLEIADCERFFSNYLPIKTFSPYDLERNRQFAEDVAALLLEEPLSEPALVNALSKIIPERSQIYLGNSMPIRNWDVAATNESKNFSISATRGLNGIDGQLSCFLGLATPQKENWAILGDFTTLYDLSAPWILPQLEAEEVKLVILNNYGGRIFARKFREIEIQNTHTIEFEHFAKMWSLPYQQWNEVPEVARLPSRAIIELRSNFEATERFWKRYNEIKQGSCLYFQ